MSESIQSDPSLRGKRGKRRKQSPEKPVFPDDLLRLENVPATKPLPKDLDERFRTRHAVISPTEHASITGKPDISLIAKGPSWELAFPSGTFLGLRVQSSKRVKPGSIAPKSKEFRLLGAFQPPWFGAVYHPKLAPPPRRRPLRRRKGRRAVPVTQGIFGSDDRVLFRPDGYPSHCVGKLFVGTGPDGFNSFGTATLVGSRTILTAGHMVPWGASFWQALFIPGFFDGSSVDGPGVQSFVTDAFGYDDSVSEYDIAVMRLSEPLGDQLGYFGALWYDDALDNAPLWTLIGYPGDVGGGARPSMQSGIPVLDRDMNDSGAMELEHHGDSTPGDSGGPLWGWWPYSGGIGPFIAGVNAGYEEYDFLWWSFDEDNIAAGGTSMLDLITWARTNWT